MASASLLILALVGLLFLFGFTAFGVISLSEREPRAATLAVLLALVSAAPSLWALTFSEQARLRLVLALGVCLAVGLILWFLPVGRAGGHGRPSRRVDERDIMFARARLEPGSEEYRSYYAMRPENREGDDQRRALPGLLSARAHKAEPLAFAAAKGSFDLTGALRDDVDGAVAPTRLERSPEEMSSAIKQLTRYFGALDVGIAELQPYHLYSHVGRGTGRYGEPITLAHRWAIAFSAEMDHAIMRAAPEAPVVAESARQYAALAKVGIQLASTIRRLGWPARAHNDGNYRVIAPLVARDAGLGELGRMGLLMTPRLGPRVRLGVVTTDLPLVADPPGDDPSVIDFCLVCKKCAENCPSRSIPFGDRESIDRGRRWSIDAESCFGYWCAVGTDCGRCMTVCPFSHPDNAAHNLVRWAIRRSGVARRALLHLDDLFYGRRPRPLAPSAPFGERRHP